MILGLSAFVSLSNPFEQEIMSNKKMKRKVDLKAEEVDCYLSNLIT